MYIINVYRTVHCYYADKEQNSSSKAGFKYSTFLYLIAKCVPIQRVPRCAGQRDAHILKNVIKSCQQKLFKFV